jgi:hypothetical protein
MDAYFGNEHTNYKLTYRIAHTVTVTHKVSYLPGVARIIHYV